jgi:hypothetical protein
MKKNYFFSMVMIVMSFFLQAQNFSDNGINYTITDVVNFYAKVGDNQGLSGNITIPATANYLSQDYTVTSIKDYAFSGSTITGVTIPNTVITIQNDAFSNCSSLSNVSMGDSVTSIGNGAFYKCTDLTSIEMPNLLTSLGTVTFFACTSLTEVSLGSSISSIGNQSFAYCHVLNVVTITTPTPPTINTNVFEGLTLSNIALNVSGDNVSAYQSATVWSDFNVGSILGFENLELGNLEIFPNPFVNHFQVKLPNNITLKNVLIYNMVGQLVVSRESNFINTSALLNGQYYVSIETNSGRVIKRIIKK